MVVLNLRIIAHKNTGTQYQTCKYYLLIGMSTNICIFEYLFKNMNIRNKKQDLNILKILKNT